jgi:DNA-binding NarL/FixJ family response regulator
MSETVLAVVVDTLEFRRACVASLLGDWAATEEIALVPLSLEQARRRLRDETECRLIVFNVGSAASSQPDVLAEIKALRAMAPAAALVIVADGEDPGDVLAAMQAGAEAYVSNVLAPDLVFRALSFVLNGGTYFPRSIVDKGPVASEPELHAVNGKEEVAEVSGATRGGLPGLTVPEAADRDGLARSAKLLELSERQLAILAGLCRGEPNKVIGRTLNLPESTVKVHVREIMRKLSASNRTQVALIIARMSPPIAATVATSLREIDAPAGIPANRRRSTRVSSDRQGVQPRRRLRHSAVQSSMIRQSAGMRLRA